MFAFLATALTFLLRAIWGSLATVVDRLRFDGISANLLPATTGAMGPCAGGVEGFHAQVKITNVSSKPIAVERIGVEVRVNSRAGVARVDAARRDCGIELIEDGPYGTHFKPESLPIVVPTGGQVYLHVNPEVGQLGYYQCRRRFLVFPDWRPVMSLVPQPDGTILAREKEFYFGYVRFVELRLMMRINGKSREFPIERQRLNYGGWVDAE